MRKRLILAMVLAVLLAAMILTRRQPEAEAGGNEPAVEQAAGQSEAAPSGERKPSGKVTTAPGGGIEISIERDGGTETHVFSDVQADDWYVEAVNYVVSNGLMNGVADETGGERFRPDFGMTRAQLAVILYRFAGGEPTEPKREYADVLSGEWYYDSVNWADAQGLIAAEGEDTFGVDEYCCCEEVLTALYLTAGSPASSAGLEDYPYAPKVSEKGLNAVRWAWEKGLIAEDDCIWYPTQALSRAQIAVLLMRYDMLAGSSAAEE